MRFCLVAFLLTGLVLPGCKQKDYPSGEAVFQGECVKCHKLNGVGGKKGPELTDVFQKHDDYYIRTYVMDPRSIKPDGLMPPAKITEQQLDMLVEYLKEKGRRRATQNRNEADL